MENTLLGENGSVKKPGGIKIFYNRMNIETIYKNLWDTVNVKLRGVYRCAVYRYAKEILNK